MAGHDMLIAKKAYDFSKWLLLHTGKFPKSYRFSIALRLENGVLEFTELVAIANMREKKSDLLHQADEVLTRLRILFRLSYELKFISITSYEFGSCQITELGKMLGGWLKKIEQVAENS
ncbi:diversity-generating retroelement protein Avd [Candidatus Chlorobium masyuteum]|uniref:diversity-generating retroelement protein Avd n=1 Tax=Candidatus Chlorobium masyuteum TaxID=2716876 RepID=UPI001F418BF2|nr:diversity-generating retroelement protein Avd [Candidatus Chlorobium masyuteum]